MSNFKITKEDCNEINKILTGLRTDINLGLDSDTYHTLYCDLNTYLLSFKENGESLYDILGTKDLSVIIGLKKTIELNNLFELYNLYLKEKMIGLNFTNKVMLETYRVRMYGASVFAAFGCATGFLSGTLDVYGKQKDVDMTAYSAILQQV